MLHPRPDANRGVEGGLGSNLSLDFKQSSFTHSNQVLEAASRYTVSRLPPLPTCDGPISVSASGKSVDAGIARTDSRDAELHRMLDKVCLEICRHDGRPVHRPAPSGRRAA